MRAPLSKTPFWGSFSNAERFRAREIAPFRENFQMVHGEAVGRRPWREGETAGLGNRPHSQGQMSMPRLWNPTISELEFPSIIRASGVRRMLLWNLFGSRISVLSPMLLVDKFSHGFWLPLACAFAAVWKFCMASSF
ncbi:hypothetical protein U1Q18_013797 [Sarracenia purpurea var. burkii]